MNAKRLVVLVVLGLVGVSGVGWAANTREFGFGLTGPFKCDVCHGNRTTGQYWPDGTGGRPTYVDDEAGSHAEHILRIGLYLGYGDFTVTMYSDAQQKTICAVCHLDPGGAGHLANTGSVDQVDVHTGAGAGNLFQVFLDGAAVMGDDTHTAGTYDAVSRTCSNVDCHYENQTPLYADTPATGIGWDGANDPGHDATCETCHFYRDGATYPTRAYVVGDLPDAHQAHASGIAAPSDQHGKSYPCSYCHDVTGYTTSHLNGSIDLSPALNPTIGKDGDPTDEVVTATSFAVKYGAGVADATCTNFYCHGADFGVSTQGVDITPVWNDYATATCGDCHDINTESGPFKEELTQGAHGVHLAQASGLAYGPGLASHARNCAVCHGSQDPQSAPCAGLCHQSSGILMPGDLGDEGYVWEPSRSHVEGTFEIDFEGQDRGWNDILTYSGAGTLAPLGTTFDTGTDICNRCHSTANVGGAVGATLAKQNWTAAQHSLPCENCHNGAAPAQSLPVTGGLQAPGKDSQFSTRGHGLDPGSTYPWGASRNGAGATCTDCHDNTGAHVDPDPASPTTIDRLVAGGNALCAGCHDGASAVQVSTHANTSTTMLVTYTPQRPAFELNCVECHDVHGTSNISMIATGNPDGPLVLPRTYNAVDDTTTFLMNGTVAFTQKTTGADLASTTADATKICQTCHSVTGAGDPSGPVYRFDSATTSHATAVCTTCHRVHDFDDVFTANSQDAFMITCSGCHGFPPVPAARANEGGNSDYLAENYAGGGGQHIEHVEFLKTKMPASRDALEVCAPCHGAGAGSTNHADSGESSGSWPIAARGQVNIEVRAGSFDSWDGMAGDPGSAAYGGNAMPTTAAGTGVTIANSSCAGVDCHGNPDPAEALHWNVAATADTPGDPEDGLEKSQVCEGCHDQTAAEVRVYDKAGANVYTGTAPDAAASYYGTPSGYGRGGHGDAGIQAEDPFVDADPSHATPIDCTGCHDDAALHFPVGSDLHRLGGRAIETTSHSSNDVCNSCHAGTSYPANHHPSYQSTTSVVPAGGQEIYTSPSSWNEVPVGSGHYEQDGYSAAGASGGSDFYVDWWGGAPGNGNQSPPPAPSPLSVLPLERYVLDSGTSKRVMCVTCHNPHGTDLFVYDPGGIGGAIPDNNMLRLRDSDNTLCNACH